MGITSKIEWTDATWNPWMGCHKVSQGCKNCYMYREQIQYGNDPSLIRRSKTTFTAPLKWREPKRVFTCSWSDFFIEEADEWRGEAWDIIRQTPNHTYQILTKRPENIAARLPHDWGDGWPNVWLGVSAEDQDNADRRISYLLRTPASIRFVSCEPLLGPIDILKASLSEPPDYDFVEVFHPRQTYRIDWVIVGGESGPKARTMNPYWARGLRDQCQTSNIPFFFKQWGCFKKRDDDRLLDGQLWEEFPSTIREKSES